LPISKPKTPKRPNEKKPKLANVKIRGKKKKKKKRNSDTSVRFFARKTPTRNKKNHLIHHEGKYKPLTLS